ncbi:MAG: putative metal-binding motif-containing protein [Myxococcota bacterium]
MRRWPLTLGLATVALGAALVAPKLAGRLVAREPERQIELPTPMPSVVAFADRDGDGFGDASTANIDAIVPVGAVLQAGDCDDQRPAVHPGAPELAGDGIDQDCDGRDRPAEPHGDGGLGIPELSDPHQPVRIPLLPPDPPQPVPQWDIEPACGMG